MAQTTVLPEPTRVERQEFGTPNSGTLIGTVLQGSNDGFLGFGNGGGNGMGLGMNANANANGSMQSFQFSDDELAVLAENFFHSRPVDGEGNAGWWNMGNL